MCRSAGELLSFGDCKTSIVISFPLYQIVTPPALHLPGPLFTQITDVGTCLHLLKTNMSPIHSLLISITIPMFALSFGLLANIWWTGHVSQTHSWNTWTYILGIIYSRRWCWFWSCLSDCLVIRVLTRSWAIHTLQSVSSAIRSLSPCLYICIVYLSTKSLQIIHVHFFFKLV